MNTHPIGAGDFVECVSAVGTRKLRRGKIYRVSDVLKGPCSCCGGEGLNLAGVKAARPYFGFHAIRFRPVYRPKPSWLQELLEVDGDLIASARYNEFPRDAGAVIARPGPSL